MDVVADVMRWHKAMGHAGDMASLPSIPERRVQALKMALVVEEFLELEHAVDADDLAGIADACADLIYVVVGQALAYGIDLRPVWAAVQQANMAKIGGHRRADGKVLKPKGWTPPDIARVLREQSPLDIASSGAASESPAVC